MLQALPRQRVLAAQVEIAARRTHGEPGDRDRLEQGVGILLEDHAVLERPGLRLVGVAHHVAGRHRLRGDGRPLPAGRERGAAATHEPRVGHLRDDGIGPDGHRPGERLVAARRPGTHRARSGRRGRRGRAAGGRPRLPGAPAREPIRPGRPAYRPAPSRRAPRLRGRPRRPSPASRAARRRPRSRPRPSRRASRRQRSAAPRFRARTAPGTGCAATSRCHRRWAFRGRRRGARARRTRIRRRRAGRRCRRTRGRPRAVAASWTAASRTTRRRTRPRAAR